MNASAPSQQRLAIRLSRGSSEIALWHRPGASAGRLPVMFVHGAGCSKEDFVDACFHDALCGRELLAFDAPGFGASACRARPSVGAVADAARRLLDAFGWTRVHLVGHSMGALACQIVVDTLPPRIASLTNIEGNLVPEDCFLSRRFLEKGAHTAEFVERFRTELANLSAESFALYAAALPARARPRALALMMRSVVLQTELAAPLEALVQSALPRLFVYGNRNSGLPYLETLRMAGVRLAEIPYSSHFPMYSNPVRLWQEIGSFVRSSESRTARSRSRPTRVAAERTRV